MASATFVEFMISFYVVSGCILVSVYMCSQVVVLYLLGKLILAIFSLECKIWRVDNSWVLESRVAYIFVVATSLPL